jgi:UDP-N-acetylmuramoyl-tripeptide--D-alanyl-D-alanine ligase
MKTLIIILWFIIFTKKLLFWVWLWQLKEYHLRRFKAHFQTEKGKKIISNYLLKAKLILVLGLFLYFPLFSYLLILVFLAETLFFLRYILKRTFKRPTLTKKTILILGAGFVLGILILHSFFPLSEKSFYIYLLGIDILAPLIFSGLVLAFEPYAISWRKKIIRRATDKRKGFKDLTVIGITGSYGKTSTKEFLFEILSERFKVLKTKEHQNSEVGISRCVLNDLKPEHQVFICEMGAYGKGGIKMLTDIVKPKIGVLTGINEQHLATFGSLENIIKAKYELIESLPKDGLAVFNGYNKHCLELYSETNLAKKLSGKDIKAENIRVGKEFISFKVSLGGDSADFKVNLLGQHWVENILIAILVAKELGMTLKEISSACQKVKPLPGAMRIIKNRGLNIIEATYSANPSGVISHLDYLKSWSGKKVIVMPCLIELGSSLEEVHQRIGEKIGEVCDLAIITTKECVSDIKKGVKKGGVLYLENSQDIFEKLKEFSGQEDVILLESRLPKKLLNLLGIK